MVNCHSNGFGVSIGSASFTPQVGMKIWEQPGKAAADLENDCVGIVKYTCFGGKYKLESSTHKKSSVLTLCRTQKVQEDERR